MESRTEGRLQPMSQAQIPLGFAELYSMFTPEEITIIAQVKRFFECVQGDEKFRHSVDTGHFTPEQVEHLQNIGITFPLEDVAVLWEGSETSEATMSALFSAVGPEEHSGDLLGELKRFPILHLWGRFCFLKGQMHRHHSRIDQKIYAKDPRYLAWRRRRIAAVKSELGSYGHNIDHPTLAIELAVGCSVGCYFCAFDAPKLEKVFDYTVPENLELFRGIARSLVDVLGPRGAGHALLYWSSEPHDNPHYIDFMKTYEEITGVPVCTATARFGEEWIRDLIAYYRRGPHPWPRISVLSSKVMHKLHKQFTPDEFRDVTLLMQQRDGEVYRAKVPGGRPKMLQRLETAEDLRALEAGQEDETSVLQGSIACVSGLLINTIEKTVKLTSPCYTNAEKYPYGYRTFAQASFETVDDFDRVLHDMVARKMVLAPYPSMPMRFRDDLRYQPKEGGFDLVSPNQRHQFKQHEIWSPLGELIARGDLTYENVCNLLIDEYRCDPMIGMAMMKNLFDGGFLDELEVDCPPQPDATQTKSQGLASTMT